MTDFTADWPHGHVTRDGRKARIVCTDRKKGAPIIALIDDMNGGESIGFYERNGRAGNLNLDLLNAPPPAPPKMEAWGKVDPTGKLRQLWFTRAGAEGGAGRIVHLVESDDK